MIQEEIITIDKDAPKQKIIEALLSKDTSVTLSEDSLDNEMILNMGPQHPATHGVLRVVLRLDGETIIASECELGYLHRLSRGYDGCDCSEQDDAGIAVRVKCAHFRWQHGLLPSVRQRRDSCRIP